MAETYISMRQFAKMAGVSPATVSHVFSNPESVAKDTVKHVLELAEHVGFSPNLVAKAAFGEPTRSVGVLLSSLSDRYFGGIAAGMQAALIRAGYLPIFIAGTSAPEESQIRLLKHKVDALVIGCSDEHLNIPSICMKQMARMPVVVIEQLRPGLWCDSVLNDDFDGGLQAGRHLAELGHRRFGVCIYGESASNSLFRLNGFRTAIEQSGGELPEEFVTRLDFHCSESDAGRKLTEELIAILRRPDAPTAFFATTDYLALRVYDAARALKLRIPQELSIVGFGDLQFGSYISPALTTVRQDPETIGRKTAELVLNRLQEPRRAIEEIRVPVQLIVRESTAKREGGKR